MLEFPLYHQDLLPTLGLLKSIGLRRCFDSLAEQNV
jgi:hypothetical protein